MSERPKPFTVNDACLDRVHGDPAASFLLVGFEAISAQLAYLIELLDPADD